jgi:hypothetical protein
MESNPPFQSYLNQTLTALYEPRYETECIRECETDWAPVESPSSKISIVTLGSTVRMRLKSIPPSQRSQKKDQSVFAGSREPQRRHCLYQLLTKPVLQ